MSAFVDATLLRFAQDPFVVNLVSSGIGLQALFDASFELADVELETIALASVQPRSYKVPVFETFRSRGVEEQVVPSTQRIRIEHTQPRHGRLDWVDVAFDAVLTTQMSTLVAPLQSITTQLLEQKLGGVTSLAQLRSSLLTLYVPSLVDAIFARLNITTFADFEQQKHLFVELIGAPPPPFDPLDPQTFRDYTVPLRVKIADGFDVANALQAAKLCRSILDCEAIPDALDGIERKTPYAFLTLFADAAVTDASLPGMTKLQAKTAVQALFAAESMYAQFIT